MLFLFCFLQASSSSEPSKTKVSDHFVSMGFSHKMVVKAIQEHGMSIVPFLSGARFYLACFILTLSLFYTLHASMK